MNGELALVFFPSHAFLTVWIRVRSDPYQIFTGHINVTIMEMALVRNHSRKMLMCTEWYSPPLSLSRFVQITRWNSFLSCGVPIYANTLTTPCRNCSKPLKLFLNPKIIGTLLDETGSIEPGKLLWSERAWEQLFGRTVQQVTEMANEEIRWLEQRILFMRVHLVFGWEESVGKLAILGVRQ